MKNEIQIALASAEASLLATRAAYFAALKRATKPLALVNLKQAHKDAEKLVSSLRSAAALKAD